MMQSCRQRQLPNLGQEVRTIPKRTKKVSRRTTRCSKEGDGDIKRSSSTVVGRPTGFLV